MDLSDWLARIAATRPAAVLIAGPTASGKSALALRVAELVAGDIINADSMQVYADLRILSARPSDADEARTPHRLYGFVPAQEEFSVGAYLRAFGPEWQRLQQMGRTAILVGGTGLYFKALTQGLAETPPIAPEVKRAVAGMADLHAALAALDPPMAARLDPADVPRLQRALEVKLATGLSLAEWWRKGSAEALLPPGSWEGLVLDPDAEQLRRRIDHRFTSMMQLGALDEAARLHARDLPANRGVTKAHGAPHLIAHLAGAMSLAEAIERGQADTRRYAKRQRTFFRHQLPAFSRLEAFGDQHER